MYLVLIILISQLFSSYLFKGQVIDSFGVPIEDVNISVLNNENNISSGSSSDVDGYFIFDNIEHSTYNMVITHIEYLNQSVEINFPKDNNIVITLLKDIIEHDRVVVTGTRSERHIKDSPILIHVVGNQDINFSSYSNVKDMMEMAMPNVQMVASNHGNDRVKIQGLDNKYLTFLVDGDRVSGEFAGNLDFSMLGLSNVEKIEVIEGALSTLYGSGAIGGVVNVITKKRTEPYWFNIGSQYDNPIGVTSSINTGFNKGIINYDLNVQYSESDGYDLTPSTEEYNMTLDENNSKIFNHRFILSPSVKHNYQFIYKDYSSRISRYDYVGGSLYLGAPLNRYDDKYNKVKYHYKISDNQSFKISYIKEKYFKYYYYPYYYSDNQYIFNPEEFINGTLDRKEINIHYNIDNLKYKRLIGLELYDEDYSSYNIYYSNGNILQESIFDGEDLTINDNNISLYFYEERNFTSNKFLSFGLRVQDLNEKTIFLPSVSYLIKGINHYNYRISYSNGFRRPSTKERYYNWRDHAGGPDILGNSDLKPTKNNYLSISVDKRTLINDFSVDIYRNDITDMISTEYDSNGEHLQYKNYDKVLINGINLHYYRKITETLKLKFVYNLTDASSNSDEILEGISKHSLRLNIYYKLLNKLNIVSNIKYAGKKFIYEQEQDFLTGQSIKELSNYFITDLYVVSFFKDFSIKVGAKNIFNYKDPGRFSSDILNNYDPGRRLFCELSIGVNGNYKNDK